MRACRLVLLTVFISSYANCAYAEQSSLIENTANTPFEEVTQLPSRRTEDIAAQAIASTVLITVKDGKSKINDYGSGFFIAKSVVVTNWHVVQSIKNGMTGLVNLVQSKQLFDVAEVIAFDESKDIALIKVPSSMDAPLFSLSTFETAKLGQSVHSIGCPDGAQVQFVSGQVLSIAPFAKFGNGLIYEISQLAKPGCSGGPLLDQYGGVIGVVVGARIDGSSSFAIPVRYLQALLEQSKVSFAKKTDHQGFAKKIPESSCSVTLRVRDYKTNSNQPGIQLGLYGEDVGEKTDSFGITRIKADDRPGHAVQFEIREPKDLVIWRPEGGRLNLPDDPRIPQVLDVVKIGDSTVLARSLALNDIVARVALLSANMINANVPASVDLTATILANARSQAARNVLSPIQLSVKQFDEARANYSNAEAITDFERGIAAYINADLPSTEKFLAIAASENGPERDKALFFWSQALRESGKLTDSIEKLSEAIQVAPQNANYLLALGTAYERKGEFGLAIPVLTKAATIFNSSRKLDMMAGSLANLANCYGRQGCIELAKANNEKAAQVFEQLGRYEDAALIVGNQANEYARIDQFEKALPLYRQALALQSQGVASPESKIGLVAQYSHALSEAKRFDDAEEILTKTISSLQTSLDGRKSSATAYRLLGVVQEHRKPAQAMINFEKAVQLHSQFSTVNTIEGARALGDAGSMCLVRENPDMAEKYLLHAFRIQNVLDPVEIGHDRRATEIKITDLARLYREQGKIKKGDYLLRILEK